MKVKDLIKKLSKENQEKEILLASDDEFTVLFETINLGEQIIDGVKHFVLYGV